MGVAPGSRLGPYVVESRIGAGGMGEVFKARDSRLERNVAIKVLPEQFAADPQRRARFEREARTISQLNHPHICTLHDVGEHEGTSYLVMELIEGQALSDRLGRGALSLGDALRYAAEIAEALDRAHRAGVVHRDLKPANIMITRSGAKLLDFGLARAAMPARAKHDDPTVQNEITSAGMIIGTLPYMAPEQLQEQEADARTDIFAFGAVLYEMLTGQRAFSGASSASLIAMILQQHPRRPSEVASLTPPAVEHIVMTCLQKDPEARFQCMADVAHELRWLARGNAAEQPSDVAAGHPRPAAARVWKIATAALLAASLATGIAAYRMSQRRSAAVPHFTQLTFDAGEEEEPTISPDGKLFAFVKRVGGQRDIFLQRIDGRSAINLTPDCTFDDHQPAFSPDGSQIAFRSERDGGGIFVMGATGESVRRLTNNGHNAAWSPDGKELLFSGQETIDPASVYGIPNLYVVDVDTTATRLISKANDVMQPSWSPDGRRIAFWTAKRGRRDIYTIDRSGKEESLEAITSDVPIDWNPVWAPDGRSIYFSSDRDGAMNLWRVPVDEKSGKRIGEPEAVRTPAQYAGFISLSGNGNTFVYESSRESGELLRLSLDPATLRVSGAATPVFTGSTRFRSTVPSPDGKVIAYTNIGAQEDVFVVAADGSGLRQLTNDAHRDRGASWWPDGSRIIFYSNRGGQYDLWTVRPDGSGLTRSSEFAEGANFPRVSPDATRVAYIADNGSGVRIARLDRNGHAGAGEPTAPIPREGFLPRSWSPNGKLLAGGSWGPTGSALFIYSLESRQFHRLPVAAFAAVFLDNERIVFIDTEQRIGITDVSGLNVRLIGSVPPAPGFELKQAGISNDGRTIVIYRSRTESDIWKMSLSRAETSAEPSASQATSSRAQ